MCAPAGRKPASQSCAPPPSPAKCRARHCMARHCSWEGQLGAGMQGLHGVGVWLGAACPSPPPSHCLPLVLMCVCVAAVCGACAGRWRRRGMQADYSAAFHAPATCCLRPPCPYPTPRLASTSITHTFVPLPHAHLGPLVKSRAKPLSLSSLAWSLLKRPPTCPAPSPPPSSSAARKTRTVRARSSTPLANNSSSKALATATASNTSSSSSPVATTKHAAAAQARGGSEAEAEAARGQTHLTSWRKVGAREGGAPVRYTPCHEMYPELPLFLSEPGGGRAGGKGYICTSCPGHEVSAASAAATVQPPSSAGMHGPALPHHHHHHYLHANLAR